MQTVYSLNDPHYFHSRSPRARISKSLNCYVSQSVSNSLNCYVSQSVSNYCLKQSE